MQFRPEGRDQLRRTQTRGPRRQLGADQGAGPGAGTTDLRQRPRTRSGGSPDGCRPWWSCPCVAGSSAARRPRGARRPGGRSPPGPRRPGGGGAHLDLPFDRGHGLLQRGRPVGERLHRDDLDPLGQRAGQGGSGADSSGIGVASSTSRYSASDSCPTESASPKLTFGRGENPWVNESGRPRCGTPARTRGPRRGAR